MATAAQIGKTSKENGDWLSTACILCALNCGVKVQLSADGRSIARTRGDESHPASKGYLCNKASRLNYYQDRANRLLSPMRRSSDGSYEEVAWETAIRETAAKLTAEASPEYPFLLSAGERRSFTANTILRNPEWRRKDPQGALFINPEDAARLNLGEGSSARIATQAGSQDVVVAVNDRMQRGHVSLPNGLGVNYPNGDGDQPPIVGAAPNELTWSELRDEYVGTPWHKSVPARVEAI